MKILIVTQYFWPESFRINDLALGLNEKGHQVTVLTGMPNYPDGHFFQGYGFFKNVRQNYHGVKVMRSPLLPRGNGKGFRLALNYLSFAFFASLLAPVFCRGKFDLIFIYEPSPITVCLPALLLKKLKSAPVMFWMQDLWPESLSATGAVRSEKILKMVDMLVRFIYKGCDRILVQSQAFFEPVKHRGGDSSRVLYYPNSAEELYQPFMLEKDASERAVMPEGFCVTFAGNIGAAQDFRTILNAAELLKDQTEINWVIIGDGRMFPWVKSQVIERNLMQTVHLLGRYPVDAMPRFFALSDALLVTLKKEPVFSLTIPSKIQSYLACAKPIIAALDGEGARIIEEAGAGLTCSAENPEALAEAVLEMYRMPQSERQAIGMCGNTYFNAHFEHKMLLDRLELWMEELKKQEYNT
jgi:colanic acid biosynthesis glycosyl transferase WcaI